MTAPVEEHHFPCTDCGSDLRFDPGTMDLACDHCGARQPIAPGPSSLRELDYEAGLRLDVAEADMVEVRSTACPNCGAMVEFDERTQALQCPYCATPVVTDTGTHRHIKPQGLLPFTLSETQARKAMTDWLGRLWFAPNGLQDYARKGRQMQGIYVPFWTYDADTKSSYTGERGRVYYTTETYTRNGKTQTRQVEHVAWTFVSGRVARFFDDILILASRALPKRYTDALQPWDLAELIPYRPEFLAGFAAEGYTVDLADGYAEARAIMDAQIDSDVRRDIGGDRQKVHSVDTAVSDITFKHILLPVWLAAYKYRGKSYRFVVNARSGKVRGERPWSAWKIALAVVAGLILAGIAAYVYSINQQNGGY
jgi:DNA-directed RNA polymerase subunit RPC12/RpoP